LTIQCGEILKENGQNIVRVVSNARAVMDWAQLSGFPCVRDVKALLDEPVSCDYLWSIANLEVLPEPVLALAKQAAINFHDGPLPQYAGLNTPSWAIINGETTHGVTWHLMTNKVDGGDILSQEQFAIRDDDTSLTLNTRCYEAGIESFNTLINKIQLGQIETNPQSSSALRYYRRHDRPDSAGMIDWNKPAHQISSLIRGLDFGSYNNPLSLAKTQIDEHVVSIGTIEILADLATTQPGEFSIDGNRLLVATGDHLVAVSDVRKLCGEQLPVSANGRFVTLEEGLAQRLTDVNKRASKHESFWIRQLTQTQPVQLPFTNNSGNSEETERVELELETSDLDLVLAYHMTYLARICGTQGFDVLYSDTSLQNLTDSLDSWFKPCVPWRLEFDPELTWQENSSRVQSSHDAIRRKTTYSQDLIARNPLLSSQEPFSVAVSIVQDLDQAIALPGVELTILLDQYGRCAWVHQSGRLDSESIRSMQAQLQVFIKSINESPRLPLSQLSIIPDEEHGQMLHDWNDTETALYSDKHLHQLIEEQAKRTPEQVAVRCGDRHLTYGQLDDRSNQLAHHLNVSGVGLESLVGVFLDRSVDMMVALLGILKAGGAYVPLDPDYPRDRIDFMVQDANLGVIVTQQSLLEQIPPSSASIVTVDAVGSGKSDLPTNAPSIQTHPDNLAYIIYTSGSTGKPKGVQIEHRQAVNFFCGMDKVIGTTPGVWLAVTSLSFDISILELFWTLSHGFEVIIYSDELALSTSRSKTSSRAIDFSLFYFSSNEDENQQDKYRLLLEGARFADNHGFAAVWTPERHFHSFGGLYPNPSVTCAALATITKNIQLRSGSCVLPLHHPARVAEEWAVVDNLSHGRAALSFAAGWQPDDFLLRPEGFADRKNNMLRDIEIVRALWRGESVEFMGAQGQSVSINTRPRPIQPELPFWITAAGNPETFEMAGATGANLLTHLLGQRVDELAEKIEKYRKARADAGHEGPGIVSLMLHTFLGSDMDVVRETVKQPLIEYLRSAADLIKQYAWAFPAFKRKEGMSNVDLQSLASEDMDALLEFAFERYFETSGLFGTPNSCGEMIERIKAAGVDDCACLIDFGVPTDQVLESLPHLDELNQMVKSSEEAGVLDHPLATLVRRHGVTHMQCTPSMASMLIQDDSVRDSLGDLQALLVGGEALPASLAQQLHDLVDGPVINMYGPTETTIWSATHTIKSQETPVPIGKPIANTQLYIVDRQGQLTPKGVAGELLIGGEGVGRGYLGRPDLSAQRFVPNPFTSESGRVYRTGDLVRWRHDGVMEFLGRLDHQVKLRGHRIELEEIEATLRTHKSVREAVVIVREDQPGDKRLVAYLTEQLPGLSSETLRDHLRMSLPDYMVPAHLVTLDSLPLTPNAKIDRQALPQPEQVMVSDSSIIYSPPESHTEEAIANVWREVLRVPKVGIGDNFFDLGGHSLLAIQAMNMMRENLPYQITITDLFRFPTIRALASYLEEGSDSKNLDRSADRAQSRRSALLRRQKPKPKRPSSINKI